MNRTKELLKKAVTAVLLATLIVVALPSFSMTSYAAGYKIKINRATNVVTIYNSEGEAVKAMTCSTGGGNTPLGTFSAGQKYRWQTLDGPCYGQYCTRITGHVLFHSVWYYSYDLNSQSTAQYNKLGTAASHGCVRLTVADAKWIYDNVPSGTSITIFDGTEKDDPLGKPKTIKVSEDTRGGWDPTDPDPNNPYKALRPKINVSAVKKVVSYGKKSNYKTAVRATDSGGGDITGDIKIKGKVNTKKLGTYKVVYRVTDALGHQAKKTIKIKVVDDKKAKITGVSSQKVEIDTKLNLRKNLKVKTVDGTNLLSKTKIYVQKPYEEKYTKVSSGSYTFDMAGKYMVKYSVTNPHNKKVTIKKIKVVVSDSGAPRISVPAEEDYYTVDEQIDLLDGVTATSREGEDLMSTMVITVRTPSGEEAVPAIVGDTCIYKFEEEGKYTVSYTAANNLTQKSTTVKVTFNIE